MGKKLLSIVLLPVFLMAAVFVCPCSAAFAEQPVQISKSHDCCDNEMNCPPQACSSHDSKSVLPKIDFHPVLVNVAPAFLIDVVAQQQHEISFSTAASAVLASTSFERASSLSPPRLFIKHSSLLI